MFRPTFLLAVFAVTALGQEPADTGVRDKESQAITIKRRTELTDEDLRKQLLFVVEIGLNQGAAKALYTPIEKAGRKVTELPPDLGPKFYAQLAAQMGKSAQLTLPWRAGTDCELGKEAAERLHVLSTHLRDFLRKSTPTGDVRPDPVKLLSLIRTDKVRGKGSNDEGGERSEWRTSAAIPTLMQLLQAENTPVRKLLVDLLADIEGKDGSIALAYRALFDLSPDVRAKAVNALSKRPAADYQQVLKAGLRYPWPAAADHAAEAIAALKLTGLVPDMVRLLKEPSPNQPFQVGKVYVVQEVVRVNHLSNCMLCHAPSLAKGDLVRGRVPMPGEDPPPLYYAAQSGIFVRADITYLRQDFSVVQPVKVPGKWPGNQRYDYVLRTRKLTAPERKAFLKLEKEGKLAKSYQQQEAVLFALRRITKTDAGDTYEDWNRELPKLLKAIKADAK